MDRPEKIIPPQRQGGKSSTKHTIRTRDLTTAREIFIRARENLMHVNRWHSLAGKLSATFQLTDKYGKPIDGPVKEGNFFKIGMPAVPGNPEGKGYDWVQVEAIEHQNKEEFEWTAIRVRPAESPVPDTPPSTAHFFTSEASSSFCVQRKFNRVTASVFGRNEKLNVRGNNFFAKIRNVVIGIAAILGMSKTQWSSLVKGIIENSKGDNT
jgi:hypothetical protein